MAIHTPAPALMVVVDRPVRGEHAVVLVAGEIDLDSAPALHAVLERCLREGIRTIDIDARAVTFCDASGLNVLLAAAHRAAAAGVTLTLRRPSRQVVRLRDVTATTTYLTPAHGPPLTDPGRTLDAAAARAS
ncbi:anti-sigma B factor antagonist [Streptomyces sp. TLI_235]|nr:STAS domain-containing protein [Streptomyces sp. TLI_235]PBC70296.1 anti-sigma B factor antagonist [Streptomyces sp. TLI_235]